MSKLLGKETIDTNTYGQSKGRSGSYSTNWQLTGRELLMPDEVRMLDNRYALLFIRGERPVKDLKFDILKHQVVKDTADGDAGPYLHGQERDAVAAIELFYGELEEEMMTETRQTEYELLSEEELQKLYDNEEDRQ